MVFSQSKKKKKYAKATNSFIIKIYFYLRREVNEMIRTSLSCVLLTTHWFYTIAGREPLFSFLLSLCKKKALTTDLCAAPFWLRNMGFSFAPTVIQSTSGTIPHVSNLSTTVFIRGYKRFEMIRATTTKDLNFGRPKNGGNARNCKGLWLREIL